MKFEREAAVSGSFYPEDCSKIKTYFQKFRDFMDRETQATSLSKITPRAIIVPHAGYVYSGFTANIAYTLLADIVVNRVIVIGPSHHHYFEGISGSYFEEYETPCGDIEIDSDYLIALAQEFKIGFEAKAHIKEHSTEVQMPFIKEYLPNAKVVELVYGKISSRILSDIITYILKDDTNVVVISSDLSHFYTQEKARKLDNICLDAIVSLDSQRLDEGCEACGLLGIKAMIRSSCTLKLQSQLLDYRTSFDYSGDKSRVVGYASAVLY